mmetsp:Transcript_43670/g.127090  ORF Transcript_43670/g.127090 Transcript_43670/m.127090 type:complete len:452 (+) Transcript_43670:36-1391(+)|eukprot:CAMPEP_0170252926 /NCGR_PEP_ID=MMETSP0116_2-20130129/26300_1 /TAXON_ID=400756 /ORGANISM="Durinskia baltica, Strain CSIRO CS-38" /LENGTH=451 /DNA_ID=CAMNT_0010503903 /DNA_START=31 /DNA_END=1386 /DNA_ORIENTATION=+
MPTSLLSDVLAVHAFLDAHAAAGDFARVRGNMCRSVLAKLQAVNIELPEATSLTATFQNGPWSETELAQLQAALVDKISAPKCSATKNNTQTLLHFEHYMSASFIDALRSDAISTRAKLMRSATMLVDLGCPNPSERTVQGCIALTCLVAMGEEELETMSAACKLNSTRDFKAMIKLVAKSSQHDSLLPVFPPTAIEWKAHNPELFQKIFGSAGPVPLQIKHTVLAAAVSRWPMRQSSSAVKAPTDLASVASGPSSSQAMQGFMQCMQMMQSLFAKAAAPPQLDITMTPPAKISTLVQRSASVPLLALRPPEPKPTMDVVLPEGVAETPTPPIKKQKHDEHQDNSSSPLGLDDLEAAMREQFELRADRKRREKPLMKKPAAAVAVAPSASSGASGRRRPTPSADGSPVPYLGGVIYTSKTRFRAMKVRGDRIDCPYSFKPGEADTIQRAWG